MGHASIEETTATGTRQTSTGDRLQAHFAPAGEAKGGAKSGQSGATQVQSAVLDGHVVLTQTPAAKPGGQAEAPLRATAGRAVYESTGEWLHLTLHPRVVNGGFELTADKVDVSHDSGDAFAHGNVKATYVDTGARAESRARALPALGEFWREGSVARGFSRGATAPGHRRGYFQGSCAAVAAGKLGIRAGDCAEPGAADDGGAQHGCGRAGEGGAVEQRAGRNRARLLGRSRDGIRAGNSPRRR